MPSVLSRLVGTVEAARRSIHATAVAGSPTARCGWSINSWVVGNCGAAQGVDGEDLLAKLQEFHRVHKTPIDQAIRDLHEAFAWLPKSAYAAEAKPLAELARKKRRGPQRSATC